MSTQNQCFSPCNMPAFDTDTKVRHLLTLENCIPGKVGRAGVYSQASRKLTEIGGNNAAVRGHARDLQI